MITTILQCSSVDNIGRFVVFACMHIFEFYLRVTHVMMCSLNYSTSCAHTYSPYCRDFAPHVLKSHAALATDRRCKVIFMSADKSDENYEIMCNKLKGIPTLPYDLTKTQFTRDLFNLKTIPVLIILRNKHFDREVPDLVTNARHLLVEDPTLSQCSGMNPRIMVEQEGAAISTKSRSYWK